jgi:hypothetical protein
VSVNHTGDRVAPWNVSPRGEFADSRRMKVKKPAPVVLQRVTSTWLTCLRDKTRYDVPVPCLWSIRRQVTANEPARVFSGPKLNHTLTLAAFRALVDQAPGRYWFSPLDPERRERYGNTTLAYYDLEG